MAVALAEVEARSNKSAFLRLMSVLDLRFKAKQSFDVPVPESQACHARRHLNLIGSSSALGQQWFGFRLFALFDSIGNPNKYETKSTLGMFSTRRNDMDRAHAALTLQMLGWIAQGNHSYSEVLDVWKSTCPRLAIWEDACADGLIDSAPGMSGVVSLTEKGKNLLAQHHS